MLKSRQVQTAPKKDVAVGPCFVGLCFGLFCRMQSIFQLRIWNRIVSRIWTKFFLNIKLSYTLREMRKYSGAKNSKDANLHPNMFDHLHMKLFRAQRNLYISGFSLFLWLTTASLQTKAESDNQTAKKYIEDNKLLKQTLMYGKGNKVTSEGNKLLRSEMEKLRGELKGSEEALKKSQSEMEAMKKQSDGLTKEFDRLLKEHRVTPDLLIHTVSTVAYILLLTRPCSKLSTLTVDAVNYYPAQM
uniref:Endoplasmic reticulum transmembrane protein n=1 Tax=Hucho hucho TaxID=62062 RepID=A0A4W5PP36_9TELE